MSVVLLQGVTVEKRMLDPQPLTPQTFAQRMREVDMPTSEAIFFELKGVGIIQADNCSRFLEYETWCGALPSIRAPRCHGQACLSALFAGDMQTAPSIPRVPRVCVCAAWCCRKKAEAQLKKILLKHFPANLYAVNGCRGHERAFREMLWASEASETLLHAAQSSLYHAAYILGCRFIMARADMVCVHGCSP